MEGTRPSRQKKEAEGGSRIRRGQLLQRAKRATNSVSEILARLHLDPSVMVQGNLESVRSCAAQVADVQAYLLRLAAEDQALKTDNDKSAQSGGRKKKRPKAVSDVRDFKVKKPRVDNKIVEDTEEDEEEEDE